VSVWIEAGSERKARIAGPSFRSHATTAIPITGTCQVRDGRSAASTLQGVVDEAYPERPDNKQIFRCRIQ
jgi:hypothetical protein